MKIIKRIKLHHIIFSVFLALQAAVLYSVPLFGDDYYYASFIKKGLSFFVTENVVHYTQTNGRAIVHLLDEMLLWGGTNFLWKIFNLCMIALAVYYTAAVSAKKYTENGKKNFSTTLIITVALFSLLELGMVRQTLYWATGSMNYLFPYVLFIAYYYHYRKDVEQNTVSPYLWLLGFFACFSSEQAGAAALAVSIMMLILYGIKYHKHPTSQYYVNLVSAGAGFALQIFAPGNAVRKTYFPEFYSKSITDRIIENAKPLYNVIFNGDGMYIFVLIAFLCFGFALFLKSIDKFKNKSLFKGLFFLVGTGIAAISTLYYGYALLQNRLILTELMFLPFFSYGIVGFAIACIIRAYKNKNFDIVFFLLLAPILQAVMLLSPQYGPRTVLISALCLFVPIINFLFEYKNRILFLLAFALVIFVLSRANKVLLLLACIAVAIIAVGVFILKKPKAYKNIALYSLASVIVCISFATIAVSALGYLENLPAHEYNKAAVENFKKEGSDTLTLAILPNPDFKYTMPYDDKYHENWFKILNDLPSDLEIIYKDYSELK